MNSTLDSVVVTSEYQSTTNGNIYQIDKIDQGLFITPQLTIPSINISNFTINAWLTS